MLNIFSPKDHHSDKLHGNESEMLNDTGVAVSEILLSDIQIVS
jgi:hypothetical protein